MSDKVFSNKLIISLLKWRTNHKYESNLSSPSSQSAGYFFSRHSDYYGKLVNYVGWYLDKIMRFFNRNLGQWSGRNVHDFIKIKKGFQQIS